MPSKGNRYLALLRGINVGGKNIIAKDDLRRCFEDTGFENVKTYIQSGNVLFRSGSKSIKNLTSRLELALSEAFDYSAQVVVFSHRNYQAELEAAPAHWGSDETQKHNAMFLLGTNTPQKILEQVPPLVEKYESVDHADRTLFWSVSREHAGKSAMMKLAGMSIYKQMTVRNHKTTQKLLELFDDI